MGRKLLIYSIRMLNTICSFACRVAPVFNLFIDRRGKYNGIGNDAEWHINQTETSYAVLAFISGCKKQLKSNTVPLYILGSGGSGGLQFGLTYLLVIEPQPMQESITKTASTRNHGSILFNIKSVFVTILQGHTVMFAD